MYDTITCIQIADVDFDGQNELILGTYGQEILIYKETEENKKFELIFQYSFSQPIMSIHWADLTQDGSNNLIVITLLGIHILSVR